MALIATDTHGNERGIFWGEIAPCDHVAQVYQDDRAFLGALTEFVAGGLRSGDGVVVIATPAHLRALEGHLYAEGIDVGGAASRDQYIALEAERVLARFMVNGWPDDELFEEVVADLHRRAGAGGRRVRALGEMVALLWKDGHAGAIVRLKHLWDRLCRERALCLSCAFPQIGLTQDADASIKEICAAHSKVLDG
jgi:MEDS: MEthanogen/methylotroph, DcmR Sensory domain